VRNFDEIFDIRCLASPAFQIAAIRVIDKSTKSEPFAFLL